NQYQYQTKIRLYQVGKVGKALVIRSRQLGGRVRIAETAIRAILSRRFYRRILTRMNRRHFRLLIWGRGWEKKRWCEALSQVNTTQLQVTTTLSIFDQSSADKDQTLPTAVGYHLIVNPAS